MTIRPLLLALALAAPLQCATITTVQAADNFSIDIWIADLGGVAVASYDLTFTYISNLVTTKGISVIEAGSVGYLGGSYYDTITTLHYTALDLGNLAHWLEALEVKERSLLSPAKLALLQPEKFPLLRLILERPAYGTAIFTTTGTVSDSAGNFIPLQIIQTTPEPGSLALVALGGAVFGLLRALHQKAESARE